MRNCTRLVLELMICALSVWLSQNLCIIYIYIYIYIYFFFYQCPRVTQFWKDFESYWYLLSNQVVKLTLQNVLFGIISNQCPSTNLLNYLIIIGKLLLWNCRRNQTHPKMQGYQNKIAERIINKKKSFEKKWIFTPHII